MNKNFKRTGSVIFALILCLSLILASVVLADEDVSSETTFAEQTPESVSNAEDVTTSEETTTSEEKTTTIDEDATTSVEETESTSQESATEKVTEKATGETEETGEQTSEEQSELTTEKASEQTTENKSEETSEEVSEVTTSVEAISKETTVIDPTTKKKDEKETKTEETTTTQPATEQQTTAKTQTISGDMYKDIGTIIGKPEKYGTLYWPLPKEYSLNAISSRYGYRTGQYAGMHRGLDIAAPQGTPIYACADGVVVASYFSDSAGNFIVIKHADGIYTEYMHQSVRHVKEGDKVKAGQIIGLVGTTGWSTGPHLHIGVVISDTGYDISNRVDPLPYLTLSENMNNLAAPVEITEEDLLIKYKDGVAIAESIAEKKDLVSSLYPIFSTSKITKTSYNGFTYKGYAGKKGDKIKEKNAISLSVESGFVKYDDKWVRYETDDYDLVLNIVATYNSSEKDVPMTFKLDSPLFGMDWSSYKKTDMKEAYYTELSESDGGYYAVDIHVDIFKHGSDERIDLPEVYQIVDGIDNGKSFRSVNESYSDKALFVKSKRVFEKNYNKNDLKSCITKDGDLYSEYSLNPYKEFDSKGQADLYRQTEGIKQDGLDLVYGFEHNSTAVINFYAPRQSVKYNASEGGKVNNTGELVLKGAQITETAEAIADEDYQFIGWFSDQDLMLDDELIIKAGDEISMEDIEGFIVNNDISFTAQFEKSLE